MYRHLLTCTSTALELNSTNIIKLIQTLHLCSWLLCRFSRSNFDASCKEDMTSWPWSASPFHTAFSALNFLLTWVLFLAKRNSVLHWAACLFVELPWLGGWKEEEPHRHKLWNLEMPQGTTQIMQGKSFLSHVGVTKWSLTPYRIQIPCSSST